MANLLSTQEGQTILRRAACWLASHRISRALKRSFFRAFKAWESSGTFDLSVLLNNLNPTTQDELLSLGQMFEAIGCPNYVMTTQNMDIYVDENNGSDTEGDGSASSPYASLAFLSAPGFPLIINHFLRIHILSDIQMVNQVIFPQIIMPNGCITLMGDGPESVVTTSQGAGPFAIANPGAHTIYQSGASLYQAHNFHTATNFNVDELAGKWIQFLSGDLAGYALPVHSNEANNIWTRVGWPVGGVDGDTFQIIEPAFTLSLPGITFACRGSDGLCADVLLVPQSRFNVYNLEIDIAAKGLWYPCTRRAFHLKNGVLSNFSFVRITRGGSSGNDIILFQGTDLNYGNARDPVAVASQAGTSVVNLDKFYEEDASTAMTNSGVTVWNNTWPPMDYGWPVASIEGPIERFHSFDSYGSLFMIGNAYNIKGCGFDTFTISNGNVAYYYHNLLSGRDDSAGPTFDLVRGYAKLSNLYFRRGTDNIRIRFGRLEMGQCNGMGAAGYAGYGIRFDRSGDVVVTDDPAPITGTGGNLWFTGGTGVLPYPALNGYQGAEGNGCLRLA